VVTSERRRWETSAGSGGCLSRQSRTAASQIKRARWCCPGLRQFKVGAEDAGMGVDAVATLLVGMLSKRGIDATAKQLVKLVKLGQRWGHLVDTQLLFSVSEWLWQTVLETLKATASYTQRADEAPFQKCLIRSPASVRPGHWSDIKDVILDGQWNVASSIGDIQELACPVVQVNGHGKWEPHDWKILQQARNTIFQYGVKAEATRQIVTWISSADLMCPYDCQSLMRLLLTPTQFLLWGSVWIQRAVDEAMRHLDPYYEITAEEKVASVIQKSPFVANVPPEESREQGLGPTDSEKESGLFPRRLAGGWDSHLERSESSIKKFLQ